MSLRTSETNYLLAKELNRSISEKFEILENGASEDKEFLAVDILNETAKLSRTIDRINLSDFVQTYCSKDVAKFKEHVEMFKETAFYMKRTVTSMVMYDKVRPALKSYLKEVDWFGVAKTEQEVAERFGRFITNEDNCELHKNAINSIVKGSMRMKAFRHLFETLRPRFSTVRQRSTC